MLPIQTPQTLAAKVLVAVAVAAVVFVAGAITGATVQGWRKDATISGLKAEYSGQKAANASAVIADMERSASAIHEAATRYAGFETTLAGRIDVLRKELKNAKPLPVDCVPDVFRVQQLRSAVDAANKKAAARHASGPAMPAN